MSNKELLYIKDAIGHQKQIETKIQNSLGTIKDPALKEIVNSIYTRQKNISNSLYGLLGGNK